ncbi:RNA polymerase, sigma subunit, ECF family [Bryocella elongata]|uniref:RNA polymerase, sigma subunit, ECF family n=1 Tax=Bryocella elongata TaxID=863522 RepID=A0A1H6AU22_9BACT|nr:ECF-type sigma factor [Bryocella elongata]SEG52179.1 RNA polymerase, sigma subunit, ECF family [Bryocella elongata]
MESTAPAQDPDDVTLLLQAWSQGEPLAADRLFERVYPHLRYIASALFRGERKDTVLQPTIVVHELFLKLIRQRKLQFEDRQHFYGLCAKLMRRILIDRAREQRRLKRDGGIAIELEEHLAWVDARDAGWMDVDRVLMELEALDPKMLRILELRFFLGCTATETAELTGISKSTVDRALRFLRGWLYERLRPQGA